MGEGCLVAVKAVSSSCSASLLSALGWQAMMLLDRLDDCVHFAMRRAANKIHIRRDESQESGERFGLGPLWARHLESVRVLDDVPG